MVIIMDFNLTKTDLKQLQSLDLKYSVDDELDREYNAICSDFTTLKIRYEAIKTARRLPQL